MKDITNLFIDLIAKDTVSDPTSKKYPSTSSQTYFADYLVKLIKEEGVEDVYKDEYSIVYCHVNNGSQKTIGLIAHMDTSPSLIGGIKNPRIISSYDGSDVVLSSEYTMKVDEFPHLKELVGEDIIVTDGDHLLGGDDKAGIAIILSFLTFYLKHKNEFKYNLAIAFTCDEEIGRGADKFDINKMKADVAYTLDGGPIYYANYENFNASRATLTIYGVGVHPGSAKDIMVNALSLGCLYCSRLPQNMTPETTEGREGFIHLASCEGDVEKATFEFILRDHDKALLEDKKELMRKELKKLEKEFPRGTFYLDIKDEYRNMFDYFKTDMKAIDLINTAYLRSKVKLQYEPIRGGTDGATITYKGLPCPNLGVGGYAPHGRYETVSITQMVKMVDILKELFKS